MEKFHHQNNSKSIFLASNWGPNPSTNIKRIPTDTSAMISIQEKKKEPDYIPSYSLVVQTDIYKWIDDSFPRWYVICSKYWGSTRLAGPGEVGLSRPTH